MAVKKFFKETPLMHCKRSGLSYWKQLVNPSYKHVSSYLTFWLMSDSCDRERVAVEVIISSVVRWHDIKRQCFASKYRHCWFVPFFEFFSVSLYHSEGQSDNLPVDLFMVANFLKNRDSLSLGEAVIKQISKHTCIPEYNNCGVNKNK